MMDKSTLSAIASTRSVKGDTLSPFSMPSDRASARSTLLSAIQDSGINQVLDAHTSILSKIDKNTRALESVIPGTMDAVRSDVSSVAASVADNTVQTEILDALTDHFRKDKVNVKKTQKWQRQVQTLLGDTNTQISQPIEPPQFDLDDDFAPLLDATHAVTIELKNLGKGQERLEKEAVKTTREVKTLHTDMRADDEALANEVKALKPKRENQHLKGTSRLRDKSGRFATANAGGGDIFDDLLQMGFDWLTGDSPEKRERAARGEDPDKGKSKRRLKKEAQKAAKERAGLRPKGRFSAVKGVGGKLASAFTGAASKVGGFTGFSTAPMEGVMSPLRQGAATALEKGKGVAATAARGAGEIMSPLKGVASTAVEKGGALARGAGGMLKGAGGAIAKKVPLLGPLLSAVDTVSTLADETKSAKEKAGSVVNTAGSMGGAAAGAAAGAALGSVVPIIGTAIGGILGGIVGGMAGGPLLETVTEPAVDAMFGDEVAKPAVVDATVAAASTEVKKADVQPAMASTAGAPAAPMTTESGVIPVRVMEVDGKAAGALMGGTTQATKPPIMSDLAQAALGPYSGIADAMSRLSETATGRVPVIPYVAEEPRYLRVIPDSTPQRPDNDGSDRVVAVPKFGSAESAALDSEGAPVKIVAVDPSAALHMGPSASDLKAVNEQQRLAQRTDLTRDFVPAMTDVMDPIQLALAQIAKDTKAIREGLKEAEKDKDSIFDSISSAWDSLKSGVSNFFGSIKTAGSSAAHQVGEAYDEARAGGGSVMNAVGEAIKAAPGAVKTAAQGIGGMSTTQEQNKQLFLKAMNDAGVTDNQTRAAMAAVAEGETHFKIGAEKSYSGTANSRIRGIFQSKTKGMSDEQLTALKANPEAFFNHVYKGVNGNKEAGDGYKYRGRGFIQLTGKGNYEKYGRAAGVDLVNNPDLLSDPAIAARVSVEYMKDRTLHNQGSVYENVARGVGNAVGSTEVVKRDAYQRYMAQGQFAAGKQANLAGLPVPGGGTGTPVDSTKAAVQLQQAIDGNVEGINNQLASATQQAINNHIGYSRGAHGSLASGKIDCSGWVASINKDMVDQLNDPEIAKSMKFGNTAADMIKGVAAATGKELSGTDVNAANLKEGMLIGLDAEQKKRNGRYKDIDHVAQVVRDPKTGQMMVSESSGYWEGVHTTPLEKYVNSYQKRGKGLYAVDPYAKVRGEGGELPGKQTVADATTQAAAAATPAAAPAVTKPQREAPAQTQVASAEPAPQPAAAQEPAHVAQAVPVTQTTPEPSARQAGGAPIVTVSASAPVATTEIGAAQSLAPATLPPAPMATLASAPVVTQPAATVGTATLAPAPTSGLSGPIEVVASAPLPVQIQNLQDLQQGQAQTGENAAPADQQAPIAGVPNAAPGAPPGSLQPIPSTDVKSAINTPTAYSDYDPTVGQTGWVQAPTSGESVQPEKANALVTLPTADARRLDPTLTPYAPESQPEPVLSPVTPPVSEPAPILSPVGPQPEPVLSPVTPPVSEPAPQPALSMLPTPEQPVPKDFLALNTNKDWKQLSPKRQEELSQAYTKYQNAGIRPLTKAERDEVFDWRDKNATPGPLGLPVTDMSKAPERIRQLDEMDTKMSSVLSMSSKGYGDMEYSLDEDFPTQPVKAAPTAPVVETLKPMEPSPAVSTVKAAPTAPPVMEAPRIEDIYTAPEATTAPMSASVNAVRERQSERADEYRPGSNLDLDVGGGLRESVDPRTGLTWVYQDARARPASGQWDATGRYYTASDTTTGTRTQTAYGSSPGYGSTGFGYGGGTVNAGYGGTRPSGSTPGWGDVARAPQDILSGATSAIQTVASTPANLLNGLIGSITGFGGGAPQQILSSVGNLAGMFGVSTPLSGAMGALGSLGGLTSHIPGMSSLPGVSGTFGQAQTYAGMPSRVYQDVSNIGGALGGMTGTRTGGSGVGGSSPGYGSTGFGYGGSTPSVSTGWGLSDVFGGSGSRTNPPFDYRNTPYPEINTAQSPLQVERAAYEPPSLARAVMEQAPERTAQAITAENSPQAAPQMVLGGGGEDIGNRRVGTSGASGNYHGSPNPRLDDIPIVLNDNGLILLQTGLI